MKRLLSLSLVTICFILGTHVFAQAEHPNASMLFEDSNTPILTILKNVIQFGLKDNQKTQIANILKDERPQVRPLVDNALRAQRQLFETIHKENFDEAAVRQAAKNAASAEEELAVERAKIVSEVKTVFTPEQKEMLQGAKEKLSARIDEKIAKLREVIDSWVDTHAS